MKLDCYANPILTVQEGQEVLLRGRKITGTIVDEAREVSEFNRAIRRLEESGPELYSPPSEDMDPESYHKELSRMWLIPDKYKNIDLLEYLRPIAQHPERLESEMQQFRERGLEPVLRAALYFVDVMRRQGVTWGVGRGSSVASYVLYLIGVHRIDPVKYNLDITEFLR